MENNEFKKLNDDRARMLREIEEYSFMNDFDTSILPKFSRTDLDCTGSPEWMEKFEEIKIAYKKFLELTQ